MLEYLHFCEVCNRICSEAKVLGEKKPTNHYPHHLYYNEAQAKMEQPEGECFEELSPETGALLKSLPDTPRSLVMKAEYLKKINELQRGQGWVVGVRTFMKGS